MAMPKPGDPGTGQRLIPGCCRETAGLPSAHNGKEETMVAYRVTLRVFVRDRMPSTAGTVSVPAVLFSGSVS